MAYPEVALLRYHLPAGVGALIATPAASVTVTGVAQPTSLAHCGDSFWIGSSQAGQPLARLAELPESGTRTVGPTGTVSGLPGAVQGIACAPPGSLFAALGGAGKIVRVDFATTGLGSWQELTVGGNPSGVAVDESGNVWFSDPTAGTIAYVDAATAAGASATATPTVMATGLTLSLGHIAFDPPPIGATLAR